MYGTLLVVLSTYSLFIEYTYKNISRVVEKNFYGCYLSMLPSQVGPFHVTFQWRNLFSSDFWFGPFAFCHIFTFCLILIRKGEKWGTNVQKMILPNTHSHQTSANTSIWYYYSSKILHFINYLCMNLCKITLKYSLRPQFKYLHFRRIWKILVKAKWISSNYLCFWPFVGQSRIIIWLWCMLHK